MTTILILTMCVLWAALVWHGEDAPGAIWRLSWTPAILLSMFLFAALVWAATFGRKAVEFSIWDAS